MSPSLQLRSAIQEDSRMLWEWANDPIVRSASFYQDPIAWEDHENWFAAKLADDQCHIFIAENAGEPIGQVRFDMEDSKATISVSIDPAQRGKSLGTELIMIGCNRLFSTTNTMLIDAYIKPDNAASIVVFKKAGFEESLKTEIDGYPALHFIKAK
ncbi:MAG: GNAT family N-acetyltransferase [Kiritimatiellales bacterium]|nr:GNAT family N-acetyltransferase [Kiritimatiellales bacterium]